MKIVLATCGSRGDVQPMIATTLALKEAGHDVLLIGPPEKAMWARQLGYPYMEFGQDVTAFLNKVENSNSLRSQLDFNSFVKREIDAQFKILPRIIKDADLTIGASLMGGLPSIAEAMKIKYQYIIFTPLMFPSSFHPFMTEEKLTSALKTALFSKAVKQNAKTAGSRIDKTRSLKLIVKTVEQFCL